MVVKTALKMPLKTPVFWIKVLRNQIPKRLKTGFLLEAIKVLWALEE
ncbi:hypothetical protein N198_05390 [Helicobacter pylori UM037]|uniref:Uncharacterized protein n=1 Tax=Helicobacter pylori UM037 TaxID=1321939 RepID=A0AB33Z8L8_HELPX|nr:hypothetical protein N198_05390 [Helicobacter pylori UM037]